MSVSGSPHAMELASDGDWLYVADSSDGVQAVEQRADGSLVLARQPPRTSLPRCTSVAVHAPSRSVFCVAADTPALAGFSLLDPAHPRPLYGDFAGELTSGNRDVFVRGDSLFVAAFRGGLLRAPIARDGTLGPGVPVGMPGDVVGVDGDGARVVALDRTRGLVLYDVANGEPIELGEMPVDGPPLDLVVHGTEAGVALGSQGVGIVDLASRPLRWLQRWDARCVATAIDFDARQAIVGCTTGVRLFDRAANPPRIAGFDPAHYGITDVRFVGANRAVALDWRHVLRYATDPTGHAVAVDVSSGYFVQSGASVFVPVDNPGDVVLRGHVRHARGLVLTDLASFVLPPFARGGFVIEANLTAPLRGTDDKLELELGTSDESSLHRVARSAVVFSVGGLPRSGLALGQAFPVLTAVDDPTPVPVPQTPTYVSFVLEDCALQWSPLEDLAWLAAHGQVPLGALPVLMVIPSAEYRMNVHDFLARWNADSLRGRALRDYAGSFPDAIASAQNNSDALFTAYFLPLAIDGPDVGSDYIIGTDGRVVDFQRLYRGRWPLLPPAP